MPPLNRHIFHASVGMLARNGYSLIASPDRYGVRLAHLLSIHAGRLARPAGMPLGRKSAGTMKSGRSSPATSVANLAAMSADGVMVSFSSTFIRLFRSCQNGFWPTAGGSGEPVSTNADTAPPSPGGESNAFSGGSGYLMNASSRPCSLPARSGLILSNFWYVGSLTLADCALFAPGFELAHPARTPGAAAASVAVARVPD